MNMQYSHSDRRSSWQGPRTKGNNFKLRLRVAPREGDFALYPSEWLRYLEKRHARNQV